jgi:glycerol-3-phosphate acyltransferase PlsY
MAARIILGCVLSYLLGSIPFSYLVAKKSKGVDIRRVGEGNVGARNVWHVVGKKYGAIAALLDFAKGVLAYFVGLLLGLGPLWIWICGFGVVLGHGFPVFLKGRGGKGAACAMGFLMGIEPLLILISGAIIGLIYFPTRHFHLAVGTGMGSLPILWRAIFKKTWLEILLLLFFLLLLGLKRLIDEPYMRRVKQVSGW